MFTLKLITKGSTALIVKYVHIAKLSKTNEYMYIIFSYMLTHSVIKLILITFGILTFIRR